MVKLYQRHMGASVPDELVGLEPPTSYIAALFSHTAKMDRAKSEMEMSKAHEVTAPCETMARRVKAMSLFPSIYMGSPKHRTFPKLKTEGTESSDVGTVFRRPKGVVGFNYQ